MLTYVWRMSWMHLPSLTPHESFRSSRFISSLILWLISVVMALSLGLSRKPRKVIMACSANAQHFQTDRPLHSTSGWKWRGLRVQSTAWREDSGWTQSQGNGSRQAQLFERQLWRIPACRPILDGSAIPPLQLVRVPLFIRSFILINTTGSVRPKSEKKKSCMLWQSSHASDALNAPQRPHRSVVINAESLTARSHDNCKVGTWVFAQGIVCVFSPHRSYSHIITRSPP